MYVVVKGEYVLKVGATSDVLVEMTFSNLSQLKSVFRQITSVDATTEFFIYKREYKLDMSDGLMTVVDTRITGDF